MSCLFEQRIRLKLNIKLLVPMIDVPIQGIKNLRTQKNTYIGRLSYPEVISENSNLQSIKYEIIFYSTLSTS